MLRSTILRSIRVQSASIQPIVATRQYSVIKAATKAVFGEKGVKEIEKKEAQAENLADEANLKAGRQAATTLNDTAETINKKTGKVLSEGLEGAENLSSKAKDAVKSAAGTVKETAESINQKTGDTLADGIEKGEDVVNNASKYTSKAKVVADDVNKKAGDKLADGVEATQSAAKHAEAKLKVKSNTAGYKDLQDKGEKAPIEQNRPDDAM